MKALKHNIITFAIIFILISNHFSVASNTNLSFDKHNLSPSSILKSETIIYFKNPPQEKNTPPSLITRWAQFTSFQTSLILLITSLLIYSNTFHFIGILAVIGLSLSSIWILATSSERLKKFVLSFRSMTFIVVLTGFFSRLIPIARFPWMDEVQNILTGMKAVQEGVWENTFTGLTYFWSSIIGLSTFLGHNLYGPRFITAMISSGTILIVILSTIDFLKIAHIKDKILEKWLPIIAGAVFAFSNSPIYTGIMTTHDTLGTFLLTFSIFTLHKSFLSEGLSKKNLIIFSQFIFTLSLLTKYALFSYIPFYFIYAALLFLVIDQKYNVRSGFPEIKNNLKNLLFYFSPLITFMTISWITFRDQIITSINAVPIEVLAEYVIFPRPEILIYILKAIGIFIFSGIIALIHSWRENRWSNSFLIKSALFLGSLLPVYYHLTAGHIQALVKHYTPVMAIGAPVIAIGLIKTWEYLKKHKYTFVRFLSYPFIILLFFNIYITFSPIMSWWMQGEQNLYETEIQRISREYQTSPGQVASRDAVPALYNINPNDIFIPDFGDDKKKITSQEIQEIIPDDVRYIVIESRRWNTIRPLLQIGFRFMDDELNQLFFDNSGQLKKDLFGPEGQIKVNHPMFQNDRWIIALERSKKIQTRQAQKSTLNQKSNLLMVSA